MSDPPRVTVSTPAGEESVRIHEQQSDVEVDDAAFRFSIQNGADVEDRDPEPAADDEPQAIAPVEDVPVEDTLRCEARTGARGVEFLLRREGEEIVAWRNSCPHEPDVPLDPGSGAIVTDKHLVCHKHGARFERGDGTCTHGPCAGKRLDAIDITIEDQIVYLDDERFESAQPLA